VSVRVVSNTACRIALILESKTVMTIPGADAAHLNKLVALVGKTS
jgi:hypothetical protein